jgi:hypothetical protein
MNRQEYYLMQVQGSLPPVNAGICLTAEFNEMRGSWRGSGASQRGSRDMLIIMIRR